MNYFSAFKLFIQASTQFKPFMAKTRLLYCQDGREAASLDQKLQYLEKLFAAIEREQSKLLTHIKINNNGDNESTSSTHRFIKDITDAETSIRCGYTSLQSKSFKQAANHYNLAMNLIEPYIDHTKLFHSLMIEIRTKRGQAYFEMKNYEDTLKDSTFLLEQERLGESEPMTKVTVLKLHAKALSMVGRKSEAKESLGKLSVLYPQDDEEVTRLMKTLEL